MSEALTVEEFIHIVSSKLSSFLLDLTPPVFVRGRLGNDVREYASVYYVSLKSNDRFSITLEVPVVLKNQLFALLQKEVIVRGIPKVKASLNKVEVLLRAESFEEVYTISEEEKERERTLWDFLSTHILEYMSFPSKPFYTISVITGKTSVVDKDFENQLKGVDNIKINYIYTNLHSPQELKESIEKAQGDILVLIRGGGDEVEFDVFNDFEVVSAWLGKKAYRISGLGHSKHRTLLDIFSHISANTPTQAGEIIAKEIRKQKLEQEIKELLSAKAQLEKEKEALKREKIYERQLVQQRMEAEIEKYQKELSHLKSSLSFWKIATISLGLSLALLVALFVV